MGRQRVVIDHEKFKAACEQGNRTDADLGAMFGIANFTAYQLRKKFGYEAPKSIICSVCEHDRKPNMYSSKHPGICILCAVKLGLRAKYKRLRGRYRRRAGEPQGDIVKVKCLKCEPTKYFESPLGVDGRPMYHFCPDCMQINYVMDYNNREDVEEYQVNVRCR
jgi:hypothetical protein